MPKKGAAKKAAPFVLGIGPPPPLPPMPKKGAAKKAAPIVLGIGPPPLLPPMPKGGGRAPLALMGPPVPHAGPPLKKAAAISFSHFLASPLMASPPRLGLISPQRRHYKPAAGSWSPQSLAYSPIMMGAPPTPPPPILKAAASPKSPPFDKDPDVLAFKATHKGAPMHPPIPYSDIHKYPLAVQKYLRSEYGSKGFGMISPPTPKGGKPEKQPHRPTRKEPLSPLKSPHLKKPPPKATAHVYSPQKRHLETPKATAHVYSPKKAVHVKVQYPQKRHLKTPKATAHVYSPVKKTHAPPSDLPPNPFGVFRSKLGEAKKKKKKAEKVTKPQTPKQKSPTPKMPKQKTPIMTATAAAAAVPATAAASKKTYAPFPVRAVKNKWKPNIQIVGVSSQTDID